jgi:hypothetical protein
MTSRVEQIARNQTMFRDLNERIASWSTAQDPAPTASVEFYCECGRRTCFERVCMTGSEYEALRQDSARFVVLPWHVAPHVERVVDTRWRYVIVKKDERFRDIVERTDPRRGAVA